MNIDAEIDACGLNCPLPVLKAKKAMASLKRGQILSVIATDPDSVKDFEAFSKQFGHTLLESWEEEGKFYFVIQKA